MILHQQVQQIKYLYCSEEILIVGHCSDHFSTVHVLLTNFSKVHCMLSSSTLYARRSAGHGVCVYILFSCELYKSGLFLPVLGAEITVDVIYEAISCVIFSSPIS
jgi:hypothetical protein